MKIKFPVGTTAENNQLLLPEGFLSIDIERKAVRLHDGQTQGGFELVGQQAVVELIPHTAFRYTNDYVKGLVVLDWRWSDMGNIFTFTNRNEGKEDGTRVWRSAEPFDAQSLPSEPHLVLPAGATTFTDPHAPRGSEYYYLLEVFKGSSNREFTGPLKASALGINTGPGPQEMIAGDHFSGWYGTTPASEFITGDVLASTVGLTHGISHNNTVDWLKFNMDGKTLFVSQKTLRYSLHPHYLRNIGILQGETTVTIQGDIYRVRTLRSSEWNQLLYPLVPNPRNKPASGISNEGIVFGEWGSYTELDLGVNNTTSLRDGGMSWVYDALTDNISRGYQGLQGYYTILSTMTHSPYGWRPCLELIS